MEIVLRPQAENDLNYWKEKGDARILKRIRALLEDILQQHDVICKDHTASVGQVCISPAQTMGMRGRHRHQLYIVRFHLDTAADVLRKSHVVGMGEHDAFAFACGAGGEENLRHIFRFRKCDEFQVFDGTSVNVIYDLP